MQPPYLAGELIRSGLLVRRFGLGLNLRGLLLRDLENDLGLLDALRDLDRRFFLSRSRSGDGRPLIERFSLSNDLDRRRLRGAASLDLDLRSRTNGGGDRLPDFFFSFSLMIRLNASNGSSIILKTSTIN